MQFTKAEEYGVLGILYLADKGTTEITPLSEISQAQEIPEKFLAKIFQTLSRTGLIRSHRGVRGGFSLNRPADEISLKEVLEAIQGPYCLMKCTRDISQCDRRTFCALRELLIIGERKLISVFEEHTLADLMRWQKTHSVS